MTTQASENVLDQIFTAGWKEVAIPKIPEGELYFRAYNQASPNDNSPKIIVVDSRQALFLTKSITVTELTQRPWNVREMGQMVHYTLTIPRHRNSTIPIEEKTVLVSPFNVGELIKQKLLPDFPEAFVTRATDMMAKPLL